MPRLERRLWFDKDNEPGAGAANFLETYTHAII